MLFILSRAGYVSFSCEKKPAVPTVYNIKTNVYIQIVYKYTDRNKETSTILFTQELKRETSKEY